MPTLSIRTLTPANNKAKVAADERSFFFREQYRNHSLGLAGNKNASGWEYTKVEGGNHASRKALKAALERLAESPTSLQDTDIVLIVDYAFMNNGSEEERKIVKEGEKDKIVKEDIEREGVQKLIETFRSQFRTISVLVEKSPEGPQDGREIDKQIQSLRSVDGNAKDHTVRVLHSRTEVTPDQYSRFVKSSAGMAP